MKTRTRWPAASRAGLRAEIKVAGPPVSGGKMEVISSSRARESTLPEERPYLVDHIFLLFLCDLGIDR